MVLFGIKGISEWLFEIAKVEEVFMENREKFKRVLSKLAFSMPWSWMQFLTKNLSLSLLDFFLESNIEFGECQLLFRIMASPSLVYSFLRAKDFRPIITGSVLKKGLSGRLIVRLNVFGLKLNRTWRKRSDYSARWLICLSDD